MCVGVSVWLGWGGIRVAGVLDCVYSLWCNAATMLPAGNQGEAELSTSPWSPAGSIVGALYHKL